VLSIHQNGGCGWTAAVHTLEGDVDLL